MKCSSRMNGLFLLTICLWAGFLYVLMSFSGGQVHQAKAAKVAYSRPLPTRSEFDRGIKRCASNGYMAEAKNWPDWELHMAIAISESECIPEAKSPDGGHGVYQIDDVNFPGLTKKYTANGLVSDWDDLVGKLHSSVKLSTRISSEDILQPKLKKFSNRIAALCAYGGFEKAASYNETNMCKTALRYVILEKWVKGEDFSSEAITEISDPHYGDIIFKDSSGKEIARTLNCQDRRTKLAQALAQTARAYHIRDAVQTQENFFQSLEATESMGSIHQDTLDRVYCFKSLSGSFSIAQALMNGLKWLETWIESIVTTTLNALCSYVVSFVASNIDKMLNSICLNISLPDFVLKMGSLSSSKTCDGISLGQALVTSTGAMSASDLTSPFNQSVADSVFPAINSIPSYGGTINMPLLPLRRVFGTDSTGNEIYH